MPLTVTGNTVAECLRTDCNILGDDNDDDDNNNNNNNNDDNDDDDGDDNDNNNNNNNNNKEMYILPTLYLCFVYLSENKQRLVPLTA